MAKTALVRTTSKNVCTATISSATDNKFVNKFTGQKSSSSRNRITEISGLEGSQKSLQMEGISSNAAKLISYSRRESSATNYESAWGQWASWCNERQFNPFQAPANYIINFLSEKFDEGLQDRTLNFLRSAISACHVHIDGKSVGKHPKVCALLAGIFNQRPPQPRYIFLWDVEIVLQYVRPHWYDNSSLNDADVICKLTSLLALTTASRASMIKHLNTEFEAKDKDRYIFYFSKLHKSCRKGQAPSAITDFVFGEDKALCVVETLNEYINRSKPWR